MNDTATQSVGKIADQPAPTSMRNLIRTTFLASVHEDCGSADSSTHHTRAEADAAAEKFRLAIQKWIDEDGYPELVRQAEGNPDPERKMPEMWEAKSTVTCVEYLVGTDDITDDHVAQAIVEAVIDTAFVRWPKSRDGDRSGRPVRLLFADSPTSDHWEPIDLKDSEQMFAWFVAHGLEYPVIAKRSRLLARNGERMTVKERCEAEFRTGPGHQLALAMSAVAKLERELATARKTLEEAQLAADAARVRKEQNIAWHAEALARRPAVLV